MKIFKYIDGQGNVVGPATLASLQGLHKAGVIGDTTQVIDEETNRCLTLVQLLAEQCQCSGINPPAAALQAQPPKAPASLPLPPPPGLSSQGEVRQNLKVEEKLLLERVAKRSQTRSRMVGNTKVRALVCAVIFGLGVLSLIGVLAGGKERVRDSLAGQLS